MLSCRKGYIFHKIIQPQVSIFDLHVNSSLSIDKETKPRRPPEWVWPSLQIMVCRFSKYCPPLFLKRAQGTHAAFWRACPSSWTPNEEQWGVEQSPVAAALFDKKHFIKVKKFPFHSSWFYQAQEKLKQQSSPPIAFVTPVVARSRYAILMTMLVSWPDHAKNLGEHLICIQVSGSIPLSSTNIFKIVNM